MAWDVTGRDEKRLRPTYDEGGHEVPDRVPPADILKSLAGVDASLREVLGIRHARGMELYDFGHPASYAASAAAWPDVVQIAPLMGDSRIHRKTRVDTPKRVAAFGGAPVFGAGGTDVYACNQSLFNPAGPGVVVFSCSVIGSLPGGALWQNNGAGLPGRIQIDIHHSPQSGTVVGMLSLFVAGASGGRRANGQPAVGYMAPGTACVVTVVTSLTPGHSYWAINGIEVDRFELEALPPAIESQLFGIKPGPFTHQTRFGRLVSVAGECSASEIRSMERWAGESYGIVEFGDPPAPDTGVTVNSTAFAALVAGPTGPVAVAGKAPHQLIEPASTVKLLTCLTVCSIVRDLTRTVTVASADLTGGSGANLRAGDVISYRDLLANMLLPSSNTSATCAARAVGQWIIANRPSVAGETPMAAFMREANRIAFEIAGMEQSVYVNPHGLSAAGQLTTATDTARLVLACARVTAITALWGLPRLSITVGGPHARTIKLVSSVTPVVEGNYLVLGGKTGTLGPLFHMAALYRTPGGGRLAIVTLGSNSIANRNLAQETVLRAIHSRNPLPRASIIPVAGS